MQLSREKIFCSVFVPGLIKPSLNLSASILNLLGDFQGVQDSLQHILNRLGELPEPWRRVQQPFSNKIPSGKFIFQKFLRTRYFLQFPCLETFSLGEFQSMCSKMRFVAASSAQKNWSKDLWADPFSCLFEMLGTVQSQQLKIPAQESQARE